MSGGTGQLGKEEAENGKNQKPNPDEMWGNSEPDLDTEPGVRRRQGSWVSGGDSVNAPWPPASLEAGIHPQGGGSRKQISWLMAPASLRGHPSENVTLRGGQLHGGGVAGGDSQGPAA